MSRRDRSVSAPDDKEPALSIDGGTLIVVANRLPVTIKKDDKAEGGYSFSVSSGGLASALSGCKKKLSFSWIGWPGFDVPECDRPFITKRLQDDYACMPVYLSGEVAEPYYNGFSNSILWPLFHYHPGEMSFNEGDWLAYRQANLLFAEVVRQHVHPGDIVWVQDYHLCLVPGSTMVLRTAVARAARRSFSTSFRPAAMGQQPTSGKQEGDISSVFASLSGLEQKPLPDRFKDIKRLCIKPENEAAVQASWDRLVEALESSTREIAEKGSECVPSLEYDQVQKRDISPELMGRLKRTGTAVIRGTVPEQEALGFVEDLKNYIRANPSVKAYPPDSPQVFELYWSRAQLRARAHPRMLDTQAFLNGLFHSSDPFTKLDTHTPGLTYADRLRIRQPGDAKFALGPHIDGGGVERWEDAAYRRTYHDIFEGKWEQYDPWDLADRVYANMDMYQGAGACTMLRAFQGWLSVSHSGPGEGTLLLHPNVYLSTAYFLLRPFFAPDPARPSDLRGWKLNFDTSALQGANPSLCQELSDDLHPHLRLKETMVPAPKVKPGDTVWWACDTIHAVESVHKGKGESSVFYIPSCPVTPKSLDYLASQRSSFLAGTPPNDFPGGVGESKFVGRGTEEDVAATGGIEAKRAFGLAPFVEREGMSEGQKAVVAHANRVLGF